MTLTALPEPADRRIVIDPDLPAPGWKGPPKITHEGFSFPCRYDVWQAHDEKPAALAPLVIPADLPDFARDYLTQLDAAVTRAVATACVSSASYRNSAAAYREVGDGHRAREADETADRIELDPRIWVAGCMHNATPDGTAKHMLHTYIGLIEEQATARQSRRAA